MFYFILFSIPLFLAFDVGGLGFEFCVFVAGWRHALRSEWPFIILLLLTVVVSECQPPAEVCLTDLAWDYPGV